MSTILVVLSLLAAETPAPPTAPVPAPAFTNDDLDRLAPRRGEGGIFETSVPAAPARSGRAASDRPGRATARSADAEHGEEYWRREAEKSQDRMRPLQARAEQLREQIAERQRRPRGRGQAADAVVERLERELVRVEQQARDIETRLEDRARRERALPGWLR